MIIASWKKGSRYSADPQIVKNEIESIGESVTPKQMVDYARQNPESELHKCYTWDDTEAAEKWRIQESRFIMCNLVITKVDDEENRELTTFRVFYQTGVNDEGYKPLTMILEKPDERQALINKAYREAQAFAEKYRTLKDKHLDEVIRAIDVLAA